MAVEDGPAGRPDRARGRARGRVWAFDIRDPGAAWQRRVLERGASVVALAVSKLRTAQEVEWRLSREFLDDLLGGSPVEPTAVLARARQLGVDLAVSHTLLVVRPDPPDAEAGRRSLLTQVQHVLDATAADTLVAARGGDVLVLWPDRSGLPDATEIAERLRGHCTSCSPGSVSVGLGRACSTVDGYADAYRLAAGALNLTQRAGSTDRVVTLGDLGIYRLLLQVERPDELIEFMHAMLAPLHAYDARRDTTLVVTLRAFLGCGCNATATAESLIVHPNTISYRLHRIEELLGVDLRDPQALLRIPARFRHRRRPRRGCPEVTRVVDFHAHVATPACERLLDGPAPARLDPFTAFSGAETAAYNAEQFAALAGKLTDPARRIEDMDRTGIDVQAISVAPPGYFYWTDPELARELSRMQNENLAKIVADHPDRFVALATVPLQDVRSAVEELERTVRDHDFRGVEINTNVMGLDLDDPRFRPFFAKAEELDVLVLLHPNGFTGGERLRKYYLTNVVGNPLDTTLALTRIIHGGVLEEHPDLKLVAVHGGGYLPFYSSRMDHAYDLRPEGRHHISRPPSTYLKQVYVDCLVFDSPHLEFLVQQMGADHVVVGTDYPFDMGDEDIVALVRSAELPDGAVEQILGDTAARLLKLL